MTENETTTESMGVSRLAESTAYVVETLTDNVVTFVFVGALMYMVVLGVDVPQWIQTIAAMVFAFYYKQTK